MTLDFVHTTLAQRVRFAAGRAAEGVAAEIENLGATRVMVIGSQREAALVDAIAELVPVVHRETDVVMHVPVEVAERARAAATDHGADALVSVGGGSATGLAKAVALTSGLPIVSVPTTYAGSEATDMWGLTSDGNKRTGTDPRVLPVAVVYDAALTVGLPVELSVASGLNAMAHCVDSMWAPRADPINAALAAEGARALDDGLPKIVAAPEDLDGREQMLYGAYLAAVSFASAGSGLHHKIAHVLGGRYNLPHAPTHAVILPHVLALNVSGSPEAERRLSQAFGASSAVEGLAALRTAVDAPRALRDYGLREDQIADAAAAILPVVPESNPVPVTTETLEQLLHDAWEGRE